MNRHYESHFHLYRQQRPFKKKSFGRHTTLFVILRLTQVNSHFAY